MNRRRFLKSSALSTSAAATLLGATTDSGIAAASDSHFTQPLDFADPRPKLPDLAPARWLWYPSGRTLQNTFILFRRELLLSAAPKRATGWIAADSRYRLEVNGQRLQWGPAPADPRWPEADPLDLTAHLRPGVNVFGATVLFYGQGDGTWPIGKPGFLFWLEVEHADGRTELVVSDASWRVLLCQAWPPGQPKRWYLRALQEHFDARQYPYGWSEPGFAPDSNWLSAMTLAGSANRPALSTNYYEYLLDVGGGPPHTQLRPRAIPLLLESTVPIARLSESLWLEWSRSPEEYFAFRVPDAYQAIREPSAREIGAGVWQVDLDGARRGAALTFEFAEQAVGWPFFTIEAPAGTTVELLVHEAHHPDGPPLLNTHFDSWSRFICRDGVNHFETFDFESLRWLQLHIRGAQGKVIVREIGLRRRQYPWPQPPVIRTNEPVLQRLLDATINTLHNCAQETLVDGMARERQQYSGDCGHQLHAIYLTFGEARQAARYLTTFSQGLTKDGFFLDCWPAYDRLARLIERQLDLSGWGPILDHGIGFNFDCWHHYLYTGDLDALREPYPRLLRFAEYLASLLGSDQLLPVENLGIPSVWIDHVAYQQQRHKQCAFNLYAAAMLENALAPVCHAFGDSSNTAAARKLAQRLKRACVKSFWDPDRSLFVNNLPWRRNEAGLRTCDRSLSTAVLFDQCPRQRVDAALRMLADCPADMGLSYPANAGWRLWALAKGGRPEVILGDLRSRWATMASVRENNTLQEDWEARHDSNQQWSHCAVAPLFITQMGLAGIRPLDPGFTRAEIRPQPADLGQLELLARTVQGPLRFAIEGRSGRRTLRLVLPSGCSGELVLPGAEELQLPEARGPAIAGLRRYHLEPGTDLTLQLRHV